MDPMTWSDVDCATLIRDIRESEGCVVQERARLDDLVIEILLAWIGERSSKAYRDLIEYFDRELD